MRATHTRIVGGRDRCSGCTHAQRDQLNADIIARIPHRALAVKYGLTRSAIQRHRAHISPTLVRVEAEPVLAATNGSMASSEDVVAEARRLYGDCRNALDDALQNGNLLGLSLAAREVHRSLDLLGRQLERMEQRRGSVTAVIN